MSKLADSEALELGDDLDLIEMHTESDRLRSRIRQFRDEQCALSA